MMAANERLKFGVFELDVATSELVRSGRRVHLAPQPARLLLLLAGRPEEIVTREEIQRALWPDGAAIDSERGLNTCVRQIRRALGDQADRPRFIETLPKRGYRFLGPVERLEPDESPGPAAPSGTPEAASPRETETPARPLPGASSATWALVALAAVVVAFLAVRQLDRQPPEVIVPAGRARLAVLPFEGAGNAEPYLLDGLTEETIFHLGRLAPERMDVIARISVLPFAGRHDLAQIGASLGVDFVLSGTVRRSAERVRVNARLLQVADGARLWSDTFEAGGDDLFALQEQIGQRIARSLSLQWLDAGPEGRAGGTRVAAAYDAFLRGRFEWNQFSGESLKRAVQHYKTALDLDPSFAPAHAAMAEAYALLPFNGVLTPAEAYPKAQSSARAALELDAQLAQAHNALGFAHLYFDWDWTASDHAFERAIDADPGYAMAYHWYAGLLSATGQHQRAIDAVERAVELDPLSLSVLSDLVWYYLYADRFAEAIAHAEATLERNERHAWTRLGLALALQSDGQTSAALRQISWMAYGEPDDSWAKWPESGEASDADLLRRAWSENFRIDPSVPFDRQSASFHSASTLALSGHLQLALDHLEAACERRDGWMVFLDVDPRVDALRGEPRFTALRERVGLSGD